MAVEAREQGVELAEQRTGSHVALHEVADQGLEFGVTVRGVQESGPILVTEQKVQAVLVAESERKLAAALSPAVR